jgi:hypothetical protein
MAETALAPLSLCRVIQSLRNLNESRTSGVDDEGGRYKIPETLIIVKYSNSPRP